MRYFGTFFPSRYHSFSVYIPHSPWPAPFPAHPNVPVPDLARSIALLLRLILSWMRHVPLPY